MRKTVAATVAALATFAITVPAAAGTFAGGPNPVVVAHSFRAQAQVARQHYFLSWEEPGRFAERRGWSLARRPWLLDVPARYVEARNSPSDGFVETGPFVVRPEDHSIQDEVGQYAEFALAQSRGGRRTLASATLEGRAAWKTTVALRANDCAGLRSGSATIWLSKRTLLLLQATERRGSRSLTHSFSYRKVDDDLPAADFGLPRLGPRPIRANTNFRRTSPAGAAAHLSYTPELPTVLPSGFSLALSGWRPRSGITGAEGSNPRYDELFAAVYRRGVERIDVTQRLAGPTGWISDPFGGECLFQFEEGALVQGNPAFYGIGPETPPHLYWQDGSLLHTVSGPYTKPDLIAIANSLTPIP